MLATTIQLPNTTPHHQVRQQHHPPKKTGGPGVVSGPNSVSGVSSIVAHPVRATTATHPYTAHTPPIGMFFVVLLRKEVIQPHLPVRLPCYDFVPIAGPTFDGSLP